MSTPPIVAASPCLSRPTPRRQDEFALAPAESLVLLPYLLTKSRAPRLVSLPMLGLVKETGIVVPTSERAHLRQTLTTWARRGLLHTFDPRDGRASAFSALQVFEPVQMLAEGRLAVSASLDGSGDPDEVVRLRVTAVLLQHYRQAAHEVMRAFDDGYRDERGPKHVRGRRGQRIERLLNVTFEDLRWLQRAQRLACAGCPEHEQSLACEGVRCGMHSAARRYLGRHVADVGTWDGVLARARGNEGLLARLAELDGFLDSALARDLLVEPGAQ